MASASITTMGGDRRLAVALATLWAIVLLAGPYLLKPWGPVTPSPRDPAAFWTDVPLITDFLSYWTGAALVREGSGPTMYDPGVQQTYELELRRRSAASEGVRGLSGTAIYYNPPPLALLFVPLTLLPMPWAFLVWSAASLAAFAVAILLPLRGRRHAWTPVVLLLTYAGVADTLLWGQVNGVFLLVLSLGLLALATGRPTLGGALLGLLWLKPQYAVLFPLVFLLKGRWRELAGMAATGLGIAALSVAMVGPSGIARYLEMLREVGSYYPPAGVSLNPERMANWRAVLVHLWPGLPESTGSALMLALGAATLLVSLLVWSGKWEPASPRFALQMLGAVLGTLLMSPHSHFHGTVLLLAPLALALRVETGGRGDGERGTQDSGFRTQHPLAWLFVGGYLLALVVWPFRVQSWLLVPYLLAVMGLLIWHCRADRSSARGREPSRPAGWG